jgi:hypothetical protein
MRLEFHGIMELGSGELLVVNGKVMLFTTHEAAFKFYTAHVLPSCIPVLVTIGSAVSSVTFQEG